MKKYLNIFLFIWTTIFFVGCSSGTIIVDDATKLSDSSKVEWVITKKDSIIDFRKSFDGSAKVKNNCLLFTSENDSVNKLSVNELKTIYFREDADLMTYIIGGIVAVMVVIAYILHGVNITGG